MKPLERIFEPTTDKSELVVKSIGGRIGVPILLYLLGVPGGIVLLLWLFFFRG